MKKILAATDFSRASTNAMSYAYSLAQALNIQLVAVHAYGDEEEEIKDRTYRGQTILKDIQLDYISKQIKAVVDSFPIEIRGIVGKGVATEVIRDIAGKEDVSLIIMGMKGKGETSFIMGSTTLKMINNTRVPLLVIPQEAHFMPIKNLVVALDLDDKVDPSIPPVLKEMITLFDAHVFVLNFQKRDTSLSADFLASKETANRVWQQYAHSFHILKGKNIEKGIHQFLEGHPSDVIVMMPRKRSFIDRIFSKSQTASMTRQTKIPLLILHPDN